MNVKIKINKNCNLCGLCIDYCPTGVFELKHNDIEVHSDRCIYCRGCEVICPQKAIEITLLDNGLMIEKHISL